MQNTTPVPEVFSRDEDTEKHTLNKNKLNFLKPGGVTIDQLISVNDTFPQPKNEDSTFDPFSALNQAKIDLMADLNPPQVALYAVNSTAEPIPIFTLGNFSLIMGKAKSKKTFFISMLAAAAL